jgi:hypothetical protein
MPARISPIAAGCLNFRQISPKIRAVISYNTHNDEEIKFSLPACCYPFWKSILKKQRREAATFSQKLS